MKTQSLNFTAPNAAWILHREEITTTQDGSCNVYVLLDACSGFCYGQKISVDLPSSEEMMDLLKNANAQANTWPEQILILKKDPLVELFQEICIGLQIPLHPLPEKDLKPYVQEFRDSFQQFKRGPSPSNSEPISEVEQEELEAFIPDSYSPCPCASGSKFKFCCQKILKDITFAMCAAQEGKLNEALSFMKQAEEKVGRTPEVLCRYAICWSFSDMNRSRAFLDEALSLNPKHPRANYISGIEAVEGEDYNKAIEFYQTAIDNYPKEDRFHLNETYNNLGTAYFSLRKFKDAKEAWEKALVLLPTDQMVKRNLFEFIYENPVVPKNIREISPFIQRFLSR